jgi:hypothetical protein
MTTRWCCRLLQNELGPMELDELRELAVSETLGPGDLVRRETDEVWMVASKCLELRSAFTDIQPEVKSQPARSAPSNHPPIPSSDQITANEDFVRQAPLPESEIASPLDAPHRVADSPSPRQYWMGWCLTAGLILLLFFVDRFLATTTSTFPPHRRVREQLAVLNWFMGTGPWSLWEYWLLWIDSLVILRFVSALISRRIVD